MRRYGINIADLTCIKDIAPILLVDFCTEASPTKGRSDHFDTAFVVLDGPAAQDEQRVTAMINLLMTVLGPRKLKRRIRCYIEGPKGGWSELTKPPRPPALNTSDAI